MISKLGSLLLLQVFILNSSCVPKQGSQVPSHVKGTIFVQDGAEVSWEFTEPIVYEDLYQDFQKDGFLKEQRIPFLIYYAVDSKEEPFMKASVDYEVEQLKALCMPGANHVNWIILRNSDIIADQSYEYCRGGQYKKKDLSFFLDYIKGVFAKNSQDRELFSCDIDEVELFSDLFICRHDTYYWPHGKSTRHDKIARAFENAFEYENVNIDPYQEERDLFSVYEREYPLADLIFLRSIITEHSRILHPFHNKLYVPLVHIKSHGHIDYAITGLLTSQMQEKIKRQKIELDQTVQNGDKPNLKRLEALNLTTNVPKFTKYLMDDMHELLSNEHFREATQISSALKAPQLGVPGSETSFNRAGLNQQCGLGAEHQEGLSQLDQFGLGVSGSIFSQALGADMELSLGTNGVFLGNQIGITPMTLEKLFTKKNSEVSDYLFVMLEACDTNLGGSRWQSWDEIGENQENIYTAKAVYSANGSLWYRNVDWHSLFEILQQVPNEKSHATVMQTALIRLSKRIYNLETGGAKEYRKNYLQIIDQLKDFGVDE